MGKLVGKSGLLVGEVLDNSASFMANRGRRLAVGDLRVVGLTEVTRPNPCERAARVSPPGLNESRKGGYSICQCPQLPIIQGENTDDQVYRQSVEDVSE
jgi:hypothetical protein